MAKKWIQKALKGSTKGSLTKWAKEHHAMNKNGTIDLAKAHRIAEHSKNTRRLRQINLARNLRGLKK